MAAKKTNRIKQPPITREEAIAAIAEIGRRQRMRDRIESDMNDELAKIREKYESQAFPHADAIKDLGLHVQIWAEANKEILTESGKTKTVNLASGEVKWRTTPPSVRVTNEPGVIEVLRSKNLSRFIREEFAINKEAILNDKEAVQGIKGIKISNKEEFIITPFETKLEQIV